MLGILLSKKNALKNKANIIKPVVYIASPYSAGDPCINTYFQCKIFDELLTDGKVLPVAPLWSHFQHTMFPRPYDDWIAYNKDMIKLYDACLCLKAELRRLNYVQEQSKGVAIEVKYFKKLNKPVFYSKDELYVWLKEKWNA